MPDLDDQPEVVVRNRRELRRTLPTNTSGLTRSTKRQKLFFKLNGDAPGLMELVIGVINLKLKSNAHATVYKLCDVDESVPCEINCDGVKRRLRLVLKVYAKVQQNEARRQRERRLYNRLLAGKPPTLI